MIDGFRPRRPGGALRPADRHLADKMVVGDHTKPAAPAAKGLAADTFRPPEVVAAQDEAHEAQEPSTAEALTPPETRRSLKRWLQNLDPKQWALVIGVLVVVLGGGGFLAWRLTHHAKPAPQHVAQTVKKPAPAPAPKPTLVPSRLSGWTVEPSVNDRPVTGVMIENSTDARPQSGLDKASIVFEAVAEGGITRFLALYMDNEPDYIGPVRSVRPYYLQWLLGFDGAVAHVGGSAEALSDIKNWHVKDLDQFYNGSYYHRIPSRYAPHNVYTSLAELRQIENNRGYNVSNFTSLPRKTEAPAATPTASSIDLTLSSTLFNVHYDWDAANRQYKRSEGGAPHMEVDQAGNQIQLTPKVVVALVMDQGIEADDKHTAYTTLGSGHMFVFQDGTVTEGTWHKAGTNDQFSFTDSSGGVLKLNPGQTWFTIVSASSNVAYKP